MKNSILEINEAMAANEAQGFNVWLYNRINKEKHSLTMGPESVTDRMKDVFHQSHSFLGLNEDLDEMYFYLLNTFLQFEAIAYDEINNSNMARKSLGNRIKFEIENKDQQILGRIL